MNNNYYTVQEVMQLTGLGKSKSYNLIKQLNNELEEEGYITIKGKVTRTYLEERLGIKK